MLYIVIGTHMECCYHVFWFSKSVIKCSICHKDKANSTLKPMAKVPVTSR